MGMHGHLASVDAADLTAMADWGYEEMRALFDSDGAVDLDKRWDPVFRLVGVVAESGFMLTDSAAPIGGELVYGPAMCIDAAEVQRMAGALGAASAADVEAAWGALDHDSMYPPLFDGGENREWALDGYRQTVALFVDAAARGRAVVFAIL
jgi:hypothetical protein